MTKVIVVGGGFAGITTAYYLAKEGIKVELHEGSVSLGGRTKSFYDHSISDWIDNGKHLLIKGYSNTIKLLNDTDTLKNFNSQKFFEVYFQFPDSSISRFIFKANFETLFNALKFRDLNLIEKFKLIQFLNSLKNLNEKEWINFSCLQFLQLNKQSEKLINNFWKLFIESVLNTSINDAEASVLISVLKKMYHENVDNASLIFNVSSFQKDFFYHIEKILKTLSVEIKINSLISKVRITNNNLNSIYNSKGNELFADVYVFAIPFWNLQKIFDDKFEFIKTIKKLETESILNIHIMLNNHKFQKGFVALWGSKFHWLFFDSNYITLVKSVAGDLIHLSNTELIELAKEELNRYGYNINDEEILNYRIIKEKRATFKSNTTSIFARPDNDTELRNLFIAGDYTNTNLPSTIESAVTSGMICAQKIISRFN